ncbi:MAG TPA: hypothetical protein VGG34_05290 [Opitutaceae bacterium]|jgi:hypothetical protein
MNADPEPPRDAAQKEPAPRARPAFLDYAGGFVLCIALIMGPLMLFGPVFQSRLTPAILIAYVACGPGVGLLLLCRRGTRRIGAGVLLTYLVLFLAVLTICGRSFL